MLREINKAEDRLLITKVTEAKQKGIDEGHYKAIVEECETYQSFVGQYNKRF